MLTPAFKGSGKTGEEWFRPADIDRILTERARETAASEAGVA